MTERSVICEEFPTNLSLPPARIDTMQQVSEAPATDAGSFLFAGKALSSFVHGDDRPRIPVNPTTGLPYPIILPPKLLKDRWTKHHHHFPDSYLGGHALRHVYIQKTYARLHNLGAASIHQQFSIPAELPTTPDDILGTLAMGLAAHIPHEGLDLFSGEPKIRCMTSAEERRLQVPGTWGLSVMQRDLDVTPAIHMRWRSQGPRRLPVEGEVSSIHMYIREQMLSTVEHIDGYGRRSRTFEQTSHPEVGFAMLRDAARLLVQDVVFRGEKLSDKYKRERADGRLRPDSPPECADLLINVLGTRGGLGATYRDLKLHIQETKKVQRAQAAPDLYPVAG